MYLIKLSCLLIRTSIEQASRVDSGFFVVVNVNLSLRAHIQLGKPFTQKPFETVPRAWISDYVLPPLCKKYLV
jgi:hypothetical protein